MQKGIKSFFAVFLSLSMWLVVSTTQIKAVSVNPRAISNVFEDPAMQKVIMNYIGTKNVDYVISDFDIFLAITITMPTNFGQITSTKGIAIFKNLQEIDATGHNIANLGIDGGNLPKLKVLNLNGNNLNGLPSGIEHLESLEKLYLKSNKFESFPAGLPELKSLKYVDFSNNQLREIPSSLNLLKTGTTIVVTNNYINSILPEVSAMLTSKEIEIISEDQQINHTQTLVGQTGYEYKLELPKLFTDRFNTEGIRAGVSHTFGTEQVNGSITSVAQTYIDDKYVYIDGIVLDTPGEYVLLIGLSDPIFINARFKFKFNFVQTDSTSLLFMDIPTEMFVGDSIDLRVNMYNQSPILGWNFDENKFDSLNADDESTITLTAIEKGLTTVTYTDALNVIISTEILIKERIVEPPIKPIIPPVVEPGKDPQGGTDKTTQGAKPKTESVKTGIAYGEGYLYMISLASILALTKERRKK